MATDWAEQNSMTFASPKPIKEDTPHGDLFMEGGFLGKSFNAWVEDDADIRIAMTVVLNGGVSQAAWPATKPLSLEDSRKCNDLARDHRSYALTAHMEAERIFRSKGLMEPPPGTPIVPMRLGDVRNLLKSWGHPDAVFDRRVDAHYQSVITMPAAQGQIWLEDKFRDEGFYPLPDNTPRHPEVLVHFDALEQLFLPLTQSAVPDLGPAVTAIHAEWMKLRGLAVPSEGVTGPTVNPQSFTSLVRASEKALVDIKNQPREQQARILDAIHRGFCELGYQLKDDDPIFASRAFDTNPVIR
jgi:hypothetical protein